MKKSISEHLCEKFILTILIAFALSTLYPFIYFLVCSFNKASDTMRGGFLLWPRAFTLDNYRAAFQNDNILQAFKISVIITVVGTAINVVLTGMAAYALTFKKMPGRNFVIFLIFIPTIFGGGVVPTYILYRKLHLLTSIWIYMLPGLYGFFNIIIMRTFFESIPIGLSEAAYIDGCTEVGIFFKIILPLSMPIVATMVLFIAVTQWNDWYTGAFYVTRDDLRPAATLLQTILTEADVMSNISNLNDQNIYVAEADMVKSVTPESLRMTFVVIITLPIVCVYPFLQKYFVKGISLGAVKG